MTIHSDNLKKIKGNLGNSFNTVHQWFYENYIQTYIDIDRNSINEIKLKLQRKRNLQYNNSYNSKEEAKKKLPA